jgi:hypothetical protein
MLTTMHVKITVLLDTVPPFIWAERGEPATSIVRMEEEAEFGGKRSSYREKRNQDRGPKPRGSVMQAVPPKVGKLLPDYMCSRKVLEHFYTTLIIFPVFP